PAERTKIAGDNLQKPLGESRARQHVITTCSLGSADQLSLNVRNEANDRYRAQLRSRLEETDCLQWIQSIRVEVDDHQSWGLGNQFFELLARFDPLNPTTALRCRSVDLRGKEHIVDEYH